MPSYLRIGWGVGSGLGWESWSGIGGSERGGVHLGVGSYLWTGLHITQQGEATQLVLCLLVCVFVKGDM